VSDRGRNAASMGELDLLIAETSCEMRNLFLDRHLLRNALYLDSCGALSIFDQSTASVIWSGLHIGCAIEIP
jgi:hypothetical protein